MSPGFDGFEARRPKLSRFVCLTEYDARLPAAVAFGPDDLRQTLGELLADAGLTQLRIAETEKYAHVTFFFSGGREDPFAGEERILVPSPKVATYDLQPEMSLPGADRQAGRRDRVRPLRRDHLQHRQPGHGRPQRRPAGRDPRGAGGGHRHRRGRRRGARAPAARCIITADHGNLEMMRDPDTGQPHTAHTVGPVPLVYVGARAGDAAQRAVRCAMSRRPCSICSACRSRRT